MNPEFDERDGELLAQRITELDAKHGPRCGDFVRFADGRLERISHHWGDSVQTSEGGSFYIGHGYVSFSGGLNQSFPVEELRDSGEAMSGSCWFFHHDVMQAHNGVYVEAPFRVFDVDGCREIVRPVPSSTYMRDEWPGDYVAGVTVGPGA